MPKVYCVTCRQPLHQHKALPVLVHETGTISCPADLNDPCRPFDEAVSVIVSAMEELVAEIAAATPYSRRRPARGISQEEFDRWVQKTVNTAN